MRNFSLIKNLISWIAALCIAISIINIATFFYERPTGWIDRQHGATPAIFNPGSMLIHNTEGRGVYTADENGYFNEGNLISTGYTLVVGASHTAGKEVSYGERYSDVLNSLLKRGGTMRLTFWYTMFPQTDITCPLL